MSLSTEGQPARRDGKKEDPSKRLTLIARVVQIVYVIYRVWRDFAS